MASTTNSTMMMVKDPVTGKEFEASKAYSEIGGHYFETMQSLQTYFAAMKNGFEIRNGVLMSTQENAREKVWELIGSEGNFVRLTKSTVIPPKDLEAILGEGKYTFRVKAPQLPRSSFSLGGKGHRQISTSIMVTAVNNRVITPKFEVEISPEKSEYEISFQVNPSDSPAKAKMSFEAHSLLTKMQVEACIEKHPVSQVIQDISNARFESKRIVKAGEYVVELDKDAKGMGMTLGWDSSRNCVIVKDITPGGVAARSAKMTVGDAIMAVQGVRCEGEALKSVIQRLRNVPLTIILVMQPVPKGWTPSVSGPGIVRRAMAPVPPTRSGAPPPPPPAGGRAPPPPVPGGPNRGPPPKPPRQTESATAISTESPKAVVAPPPPRPQRTVPPSPPAPSSSTTNDNSSVVGEAPPAPARRAPPPLPVVVSSENSTPSTPVAVAPPQPATRPPPARVTSAASRPPPPVAPPNRGPRAPPPPIPRSKEEATLPNTTSIPSTSGRRLPPPPPPAVAAAASSAPVVVVVATPVAITGNDIPPPAPIRTPSAAIPVSEAPTSNTTFGPEYERYERMKKSGLPEGAIMNAMMRDGKTPPPGFFSNEWSAVPIQKATIVIPQHTTTTSTTSSSNENDEISSSSPPPHAAGAAGGGLMGALAGFDRSKLKKASDNPPSEESSKTPPVSSGNSLVSALAGFDKSKLKHRDTDRSQEEKVAIAQKGKAGFADAFSDAINARREFIKDEDPDDDDDDADWAF